MSLPSYPALYDLTGNKLHSLVGSASFVVGRSETADLTVLDVTCSRQQFRVVRVEGKHFVEPLSRNSPTYHNGQPINQRTPLTHDDRLDAGECRFAFLAGPPGSKLSRPAGGGPKAAAPAAPARPPDRTVMASAADLACLAPPSEALQAFPLSGTMFIGRDPTRAQIHLAHPQISRVHAHITLQNGQAVVVDLDSANGTYVNGARVRQPTLLRPGDQLDIGPYALAFDGKALLPRTRADNVELVARAVRRVVTNRETGKPLTLLDNVTLVIRPREFVCLLGPSGSGKSTLLSALSGRTTPDEGQVQVNGTDLHAHFDALKQDIAVVPQKDILHDSLSVGDALWYTARLRLPPDLSRAEVRQCIDDTLETVSLSQRRGTLIRHLSGGQVKRASLANEIMCKPSLLFLDEVTSGLDEQTDRDMMDLFRSVADTGKTVVCITHSLANVERTCHLVVILTPGGRLAFVGKPAEALEYFNIRRLGDVYERMAEQPAEHWQQAFKACPLYERYVASRLPRQEEAPPPPNRVQGRKLSERGRLFLRQTGLLTQRYFAIWRGDFLALLAMLGQSILVAVLLGILFGDLEKKSDAKDSKKDKEATPAQTVPPGYPPPAFPPGFSPADVKQKDHAQKAINLLFLLAVTSFWFGCNNAAKEIVKERAIYTRERDFNVNVGSYYCSKFLLLVLYSAVQGVVLAAIVKAWCQSPGNLIEQCFLLTSLAAAGVTLGLAISAWAPSEEMAITLIPVAVIPQIILAGVIAPLDGLSKFLAQWFITAYWGNRGLQALLSKDDAKALDLDVGSLWTSALVVLSHAAVFVLVALGVLFWQGRGARTVGALIRRGKTLVASGRSGVSGQVR